MKSFLKNLLLWMLVGAVVLPSFGGTLSAYAQDKELELQFARDPEATGCAGWTVIFSKPGTCLLYLFAWLSYSWLRVMGTLLGFSGLIFNATLGVTIDNVNYTAEKVPALKAGWEFSRDIVNIFFIFILLFIAIATILGAESYGAKRLLVWLIIMALLVNFSFLIAQTIIFVSNALTAELYSMVPDSKSNIFPQTASSLFSLKYQKDISGAITDAFQPQNFINSKTAPADLGDGVELFLAIIQIAIIGGFLILAAAFVLLAGAFFFVARLIIFWFLLILAPFGFVFQILPQTKGYANKWWKTLSDQAIFAPAFLFMILLAIMVIQQGLVRFMDNLQTPGAAEFLFLIGLQGIMMVMLVMGALIVSKSLSAYGAGAAMGMAKKYGGMAGGYARGAQRTIRRRAVGAPAGWVADKMSASRLAGIPVVGAGVRLAAKPFEAAKRARQRENDEREDKYKAMSSKALASTYRSTRSPVERREILKIAAENRKMKDFEPEEMEKAMEQNKGNSKALRGIYAVRPDLVTREERYATAKDDQKLAAVALEAGRLNESDIRDNLERVTLDDKFFRQASITSLGQREVVAMLNKFGDDAVEAMKEGEDLIRTAAGASTTPLFDKLKNNSDLLRGLFSNPGLTIQLEKMRKRVETEIEAQIAAGTLKGFADLEEYKQRRLRV